MTAGAARVGAAATGLIVIAVFSAAGGCGRPFDKSFCTFAEYEATVSGYRVQVLGGGLIRFGLDLSEHSGSDARICPTGSGGRSVIKMALKNMKGVDTIGFEIGSGTKGTAPWTWKDAGPAIEGLLERAGYETPDAGEIDETVRVINGVLSGPKGTTLQGQSKVLKVIAVDYRYELCDDKMTGKYLERMLTCGQQR